MRWLVVLIIVALAVWLWRRSRRAPVDGDRQLLATSLVPAPAAVDR